jgi:hypothetical protein
MEEKKKKLENANENSRNLEEQWIGESVSIVFRGNQKAREDNWDSLVSL